MSSTWFQHWKVLRYLGSRRSMRGEINHSENCTEFLIFMKFSDKFWFVMELYGRQQCSRRCRTYLDGWGQVSAWCLSLHSLIPWFEQVKCLGNETRLDECSFLNWGEHDAWMQHAAWCKTVLQTSHLLTFHVLKWCWSSKCFRMNCCVDFLRIVLIRKMSVWIVRRHMEAAFIVEWSGIEWNEIGWEWIFFGSMCLWRRTYVDVHWRTLSVCQDPILPVEGDLRLSGERKRETEGQRMISRNESKAEIVKRRKSYWKNKN